MLHGVDTLPAELLSDVLPLLGSDLSARDYFDKARSLVLKELVQKDLASSALFRTFVDQFHAQLGPLLVLE